MNLVLSFFWVIFSFFKSRERVCYYGLYHDKEGKVEELLLPSEKEENNT